MSLLEIQKILVGLDASPRSNHILEAAVVARAVLMATERAVTAADGSLLRLDADTICVHGDTPGAASLARAIRQALEAGGVQLAAIGAGPAGTEL